MSKTKPAAEPATDKPAAAAPAPAETPTDAAAAPFTAEQLAAIDARIAEAIATAGPGIGEVIAVQLRKMIDEEREKVLRELDEKGAELLKAADTLVTGTVELKAGDPEREQRSTVHQVARAFARAGVDLDPEQIMTDAEGWPAWAMRDGVMAVTTVDGRKVEVTL